MVGVQIWSGSTWVECLLVLFKLVGESARRAADTKSWLFAPESALKWGEAGKSPEIQENWDQPDSVGDKWKWIWRRVKTKRHLFAFKHFVMKKTSPKEYLYSWDICVNPKLCVQHEFGEHEERLRHSCLLIVATRGSPHNRAKLEDWRKTIGQFPIVKITAIPPLPLHMVCTKFHIVCTLEWVVLVEVEPQVWNPLDSCFLGNFSHFGHLDLVSNLSRKRVPYILTVFSFLMGISMGK